MARIEENKRNTINDIVIPNDKDGEANTHPIITSLLQRNKADTGTCTVLIHFSSANKNSTGCSNMMFKARHLEKISMADKMLSSELIHCCRQWFAGEFLPDESPTKMEQGANAQQALTVIDVFIMPWLKHPEIRFR